MFIKRLIKKQIKMSAVTLIVLIIAIMGTSYALFSRTFTDSNTQSLNIGDLIVAFSNNSGNALSDSDAIDLDMDPMTDAEGTNPNTNNLYAVTVRNTGTISYCYTLSLIDNPNYQVEGPLYDENRKLLSHEYIRYKLNNKPIKFLSEATNGIIDTYTVNPGETKTYSFKIWVADAETYHLPDSVLGSEIHLNMIIDGEACDESAPKGWKEPSSNTL